MLMLMLGWSRELSDARGMRVYLSAMRVIYDGLCRGGLGGGHVGRVDVLETRLCMRRIDMQGDVEEVGT